MSAMIKVEAEAEPGLREVSLFGEAFGTFEVLSPPAPVQETPKTPEITSIVPKEVLQGSNKYLSIYGNNFQKGFEINFGEGIQVIPSQGF